MSVNATPDHVTRALDPLAITLVVMLCLSWGFTQVAVKLAIHEIPPLSQAGIRSVIATLIVVGWMRLRGLPLFARDGTLWPGIAAGVLFGLEFAMLYCGLLFTTATRAVLFLYTAPFFVTLGARIWLPVDRFSPAQWFGLALSFSGIVVAFGIPAPALDPRQIVGDLMMVFGAALWAGTTLVIKASALSRVPAEKTLLYQLAVSAMILVPAALAFGERIPAMPSAVALGAMAYQTFWVVTVTFGIWFALVARYSANRLSAFTFLTPLCGVAAGHFVLGEPLTPAFAVAVALVAGGIVMVNRAR